MIKYLALALLLQRCHRIKYETGEQVVRSLYFLFLSSITFLIFSCIVRDILLNFFKNVAIFGDKTFTRPFLISNSATSHVWQHEKMSLKIYVLLVSMSYIIPKSVKMMNFTPCLGYVRGHSWSKIGRLSGLASSNYISPLKSECCSWLEEKMEIR